MHGYLINDTAYTIFCVHLDVTYLAFVQKWVSAFCPPLIHALVSTNNAIERRHHNLKYFLRDSTSAGSISDLLTTLVEQFSPSCRRK